MRNTSCALAASTQSDKGQPSRPPFQRKEPDTPPQDYGDADSNLQKRTPSVPTTPNSGTNNADYRFQQPPFRNYYGHAFKVCNVIDEFTREHIGFIVDCRIDASTVTELLDVITLTRGRRPRVLRMDNGPEFISAALEKWAKEEDTIRSFIPPGQPWHNGFVESLHNRMRDELFEQECFLDVAHARHCVGLWSHRYNTYHPHSALGFIAPEEYKKQWLQAA